jgi:ribonuclease HI
MALKWEAAVERLRQLCIVEVKWVKGHGSDEGNKKADRLAKSGRPRNTIPALFA